MDDDKQRIAELVREIQSGNNDAFNELYKLTSSRAYFVALQITKNEEDAQDILQDCCIKAIEKINSLDKPESFVSWFHQMIANKSKDYLKKKKPTLFEGGEDEAFEVIPDEDEAFIPESSLDKTELQNAVMEAVDELSDDKRACVLMMYFEEMSVNEIAQTLEVPVSTVKNRLFSARKDLKNSFAKRGITSLYSAAPIGAVIWALSRLSDAVSETFAGSAASTQVLSGITAATAAAGTGSVAAAGTGVAAKAAALSVAQKIVAGIAVAGVVTGSAVGVTTVIKNKRETETTTQTRIEEVTTAPEKAESVVAIITETETSFVVSLSSTVTSTSVPTTKKEPTVTAKTSTTAKQTTAAKTTDRSTKPSTTKKETTKPSTTVTTTKPVTTVTSTTEKTTVTTTKATTTKATTTKPKTTKSTTAKATATTTEISTTTTIAATTTTTKLQNATVKIDIVDYDESVVETLEVEVPPGTTLSWDYLVELVRSNGYEARSGVHGDVDVTTEAGGIYNVRADL